MNSRLARSPASGLLSGLIPGAIAVLILATAFGGLAYAKPGHAGHHGELSAKRIERMLNAVNATEAQRATILSSLEAQKPQRESLRNQLRENRRALHELDPTSGEYNQRVDELARNKGDLVTAMTRMKAQTRQQIAMQLTDQQRSQLKAFHQERRQKMRGKKQRHDDAR
mgnify:CR=1 FL=1